jgi:AAA ATPase domain
MAPTRQTARAPTDSARDAPGRGQRESSRADHRPRGELFGRGPELKLIRSLIASIDAGGGALLFLSEAGLGKTALLDEADRLASRAGWRVLRAAGAEFEADVGFSGLHQALLPIAGEIERLSPAHRNALSGALGFSDGAPPDPADVFDASLVLLRGARNAAPTLLIVDDVQWLDRATVGALCFITSRLAETRIAFIAAGRSTVASSFDDGLTVNELEPLDDATASRLLDARFPGLDARLRQRVITEADGNPLALLVLPAALKETGLAVERPRPALMPVGQRLQRHFADRIAAMPAPTRRLLLLAALDGTGDLATLERATGSRLDQLLPADRDGLISLAASPRRLKFRHPLVPGAVVDMATGGELREAHGELAASLEHDRDRHAWHLAEATVGRDDAVAGLLEQVAARAMRRGDAVGAVAAWLRAADLTPPGPHQNRRFAEAAYVGADVLGELSDLARPLDRSRAAPEGSARPLQAAVVTAYLLLNGQGDVDTAHRLLVGAIAARAGELRADDHALIEALYTLLTVCFFGGRAELWEPFDAALARLTPTPPPILSLSASLFSDPARAKPREIHELEALIGNLTEETDPAVMVRIGRAAFFVDRIRECRAAQWRVVGDGRRGGAVASAIHALINLSLDDYLTGEWEEAHALADEGLRLCGAHGYRALAWPLWFGKAMIAASRGDADTARSVSTEMDRWAETRGVRIVQLYAGHARALAALGQGEFDMAYTELVAINPPGELPLHVPLAVWSGIDLVIAAGPYRPVRRGRRPRQGDARSPSRLALPTICARRAGLCGNRRASGRRLHRAVRASRRSRRDRALAVRSSACSARLWGATAASTRHFARASSTQRGPWGFWPAWSRAMGEKSGQRASRRRRGSAQRRGRRPERALTAGT